MTASRAPARRRPVVRGRARLSRPAPPPPAMRPPRAPAGRPPAARGRAGLSRPAARPAVAVAAFGVAAVLPLFLSEGSSALEIMVLAAAYATMALGLNVVVGFAGLLDLGYVAFFAIAAHVTAYLGSAYWANAAGGAGIRVLVGEPAARP